MAGHNKWADIQGDITPERRRRIDAVKAQAHADAVAFNLGELHKAHKLARSNSPGD